MCVNKIRFDDRSACNREIISRRKSCLKTAELLHLRHIWPLHSLAVTYIVKRPIRCNSSHTFYHEWNLTFEATLGRLNVFRNSSQQVDKISQNSLLLQGQLIKISSFRPDLIKIASEAQKFNFPSGGASHDWIQIFKNRINSDHSRLNEWHAMDSLESCLPPSLHTIRNK